MFCALFYFLCFMFHILCSTFCSMFHVLCFMFFVQNVVFCSMCCVLGSMFHVQISVFCSMFCVLGSKFCSHRCFSLLQLLSLHRQGNQPLTMFHFGGDEVGAGAWVNSTKCKTLREAGQLIGGSPKTHFFQVPPMSRESQKIMSSETRL